MDKSHSVHLHLSLDVKEGSGTSTVEWSTSRETKDLLEKIKPVIKKAIMKGVKTGLSTGPVLGFPVLDSVITIHSAQVARGSSLPMITAGASVIMKDLLKLTDIRLAEPIMSVEIIAEEDVVTSVLQDLTRRRGEVDYTQDRSGEGEGLAVLKGSVPLAELRGYSSELRTLSSGKANLSMELSHYQLMTEQDQESAIEEVTGFSR
jgi:elongation factor G